MHTLPCHLSLGNSELHRAGFLIPEGEKMPVATHRAV